MRPHWSLEQRSNFEHILVDFLRSRFIFNCYKQEAEGNGLSIEAETSDDESLHRFATVARGEIIHQHKIPVDLDHSGTRLSQHLDSPLTSSK